MCSNGSSTKLLDHSTKLLDVCELNIKIVKKFLENFEEKLLHDN